MNVSEWKQYYTGMVKQGIRPEKVPEMIARCGGLKEGETQADAEERLKKEIKKIPKVRE